MPLPRRIRRASLAVALALTSCSEAPESGDEAYGQVLRFDTATVTLAGARGPVSLTVELATTDEQRALGLMERRTFGDSAGMLFTYPADQPGTAGFWMFRTRIPLDIAFIDAEGVVRAVRRMEPCTASMAQGCPTYTPDVPYRYALEVNAGALERWGVAVGSRVELPASVSAAP